MQLTVQNKYRIKLCVVREAFLYFYFIKTTKPQKMSITYARIMTYIPDTHRNVQLITRILLLKLHITDIINIPFRITNQTALAISNLYYTRTSNSSSFTNFLVSLYCFRNCCFAQLYLEFTNFLPLTSYYTIYYYNFCYIQCGTQ